MRYYLLLIIIFMLSMSINPAYAQVRFIDVAKDSGLLADLEVGNARSATWGDYDDDGDADVVLMNGRVSLYRNEENGKFLNVTQAVGIADTRIFNDTGTAIFLDFDNDEDLDLFLISRLGELLYRSNGDGTFLNVTQAAGIESRERVPIGVSRFGVVSFDYDIDGLLDIYITVYAGFLNPLYHNEGNGRFKEIAAQTGLDKPELAMGVALGDYDNDEDLDLFIIVDRFPGAAPGFKPPEEWVNVLYRNEGNGVFIDVAKQAGVQRDSNHMGFFWDYDNDGDLDILFQGHMEGFGTSTEANFLYRNNGNGTFTDVTQQAGIESFKQASRGASYGDYDNDGWLDLCIAYQNLPTFLYHNNGNGTFTNISKEVEIGGTNTGAAKFVDYDNDGDLDLLVGSEGFADKLALYRNDGAANHWLKLDLIGKKSNRDAIGARIKVKAGNLSMLREIAGSSGKNTSQQDRLPVHLGLGKNPKADIIEIRWPSGIIQTFTNIPANQQLTIDEIEGVIPVIYNVFPNFSDSKGNTTVHIQGEQFFPGLKVFFGGIEAGNVRLESPTLITAVTPPGATGLVDVEVVRVDGKRAVLKNRFRYTTIKVTKVIPESGPITGNIPVQIEGFGFQSGAEVQIGGKRLTDAVVTTVLIRGTLPAGTAGIVDVSATNPTGERDILRRALTYVPPPTIKEISPIFISLSGNNEVMIEGSGFLLTSTVQLGGISQNVDFISSNKLKVLTRQLLAVGSQDVVVINPDGQRAVLTGGVTVLAPIEIKSVEPNSGSLAGGTKITIIGEPTVEFGGQKYPSRFVEGEREGIKVFIGNAEAEKMRFVSDNIITAITPPNTPGPKDVKVVNPDGQEDRLVNGFIYNPLPLFSKVIPNNGPLSGGIKIVIQGGRFLIGAKVLIGDADSNLYNVASSPQVESDTIITAITPAVPGEPGPKDVVVVNPDGQEVVLKDSFTYNPFPIIREVVPNYGVASGGTKIIVRGSGFLRGARVIVGKRFATTEVRDDFTIEAVAPPNPRGMLDIRVMNPDTQEAIIVKGFNSLGELAYNYPNPFDASRGTTFRYVTNESVGMMVVRIVNMKGELIGVVGAEGRSEVRWVDDKIHGGLYVYSIEVKMTSGGIRRFRGTLIVNER